MLENGCKKFHGYYSAANFSTPRLSFRREVESNGCQALRSGL